MFWRGFGAFFDAIVGHFGWSHAATTGATSLQRSESGLISPFVGTVLDKFGPRWTMGFGVLVTGGGFVLMSFVNSLWQFYLAMAFLTIGMSFGTFIVLVATVGNWFIKQRARALSVLMASAAVGGFTLPLLVFVIDHFGWRSVMLSVGVGFWLVGFPATFVMRRRPEDYGMLPDGGPVPAASGDGKRSASSPRDVSVTVKHALKLRFFWQLAIATSLGQLATSTNLLHLSALKDFGITPGLAATAAGSIAFGDVAGRLLTGVIGDRYDKRMLLCLAFALQSVGMIAFTLVNLDVGPISMPPGVTLPVFVAGFGLGFGLSVPMRLALIGDYFGRKHYGSIIGLMSSISAVFGAIGPVFAGAVYDITDDYRPAFAVLTALLLLSVPLSFTLEPPRRVAARVRALALRDRAKSGTVSADGPPKGSLVRRKVVWPFRGRRPKDG